MYAQMKSTVRTRVGLTEFLECLLGTRQGCMLSPYLFAVYIGELIEMLEMAKCKGVCIDEVAPNIMALMFADDVAMCSDTIGRVRERIEVLKQFSDKWRMKINLEKTKIMIFRRGGKIRQDEIFNIGDKRIEVVNC